MDTLTLQQQVNRYKDVIVDIMDRYSTSQIMKKKYRIEGKPSHLSRDTVEKIRRINKEHKKQVRIDTLSGIGGMPPNQDNTHSTDAIAQLAPDLFRGRPGNRVSTVNYKSAASMDDNLKALIENAELKAELRYTKEKLEDAKKELTKLQNDGLGSVEERTKQELLRRDYEALQRKQAETEEELSGILPEYEDLLAKRKDFDFIKEILSTANENRELLMGVVSMINPQLSQRMGALSGVDAPAGLPAASAETAKAIELGQMIMSAFQGQEFALLQEMINILFNDRELLKEANYVVKTRFQQRRQQAKPITEEPRTEEESNAKTI